MNVSCTSCSAKYGIPDEKVRGKKVKITCKHCGTAIVVDGTTLDAPAGATAAAPVAASPTAAPPVAAPATAAAPKAAAPVAVAAAKATEAAPAEELSFDIAYPDDRQETLSLSELVEKYAAGTLGDDAFIWREGMSDWKAPREVPAIASALDARGVGQRAAVRLSYEDDEATKIQVSPFDDGSGEWREPAKEAPSNPQAAFDLRAPAALPNQKSEAAAPRIAASQSPQPAPAAAKPIETAKPAAARRSAARGGGDLFGDLAAAGSEDDETLGIDAKEAAPKLTGARNESSVLFSLDALVKQEQKPAAKQTSSKQEDAALLLGSDTGPSSIANVGGGSFGSAFAAPDFNAPVTVMPEVRANDSSELGAPAKKSSALWIGLIAVLVLGGGAAAMVLSGKLASTPAPAASGPATPQAEVPAALPSSEPSAPAAPEVSASAEPAPVHSAPLTAAGGGAQANPAVAAAAPVTPRPGEAASKPADAPARPDKPADKPPEAAPESSAPPFDTAAAKTSLGAAAGNANSCKTPDGPTGNGKVSVTFMPSGRATNTQVSGDLAGTAVGGCVAKLFRSAKVPPFSGDPVTVSKSFAIQ